MGVFKSSLWNLLRLALGDIRQFVPSRLSDFIILLWLHLQIHRLLLWHLIKQCLKARILTVLNFCIKNFSIKNWSWQSSINHSGIWRKYQISSFGTLKGGHPLACLKTEIEFNILHSLCSQYLTLHFFPKAAIVPITMSSKQLIYRHIFSSYVWLKPLEIVTSDTKGQCSDMYTEFVFIKISLSAYYKLQHWSLKWGYIWDSPNIFNHSIFCCCCVTF